MEEGIREEDVTIQQALQEGTTFLSRMGLEGARLDAEVLLGKVVGGGREKLYVNYETALNPRDKNVFRHLLQRRARKEPVSYIIGQREFWSLDFLVTPAVLVPRAETELLVEVALKAMSTSDQGVIDGIDVYDYARLRLIRVVLGRARRTMQNTMRCADAKGR